VRNDLYLSALQAAYSQSCEAMRHDSSVQFTLWTAYTAIIAGLFVAKGSLGLSVETFLVLCIVSGAYFVLVSSRIQRNFNLYFFSARNAELEMCRLAEVDVDTAFFPPAERPSEDTSLCKSPFPVLAIERRMAWSVGRDGLVMRVLSAVPYFWLRISFYVLIPLAMVALYLGDMLDG